MKHNCNIHTVYRINMISNSPPILMTFCMKQLLIPKFTYNREKKREKGYMSKANSSKNAWNFKSMLVSLNDGFGLKFAKTLAWALFLPLFKNSSNFEGKTSQDHHTKKKGFTKYKPKRWDLLGSHCYKNTPHSWRPSARERRKGVPFEHLIQHKETLPMVAEFSRGG